MDLISDSTLLVDLERSASSMTGPTRQRFYDLIAQTVDAGREYEARTSNRDDCCYWVS